MGLGRVTWNKTARGSRSTKRGDRRGQDGGTDVSVSVRSAPGATTGPSDTFFPGTCRRGLI